MVLPQMMFKRHTYQNITLLFCGILFLLVVPSWSSRCNDTIPDGIQPWTPMVSSGLSNTRIVVNARFIGRGLNPDAMPLRLPAGWSASVYYSGDEMVKGRFLAWGPDSVLYVMSMNKGTVIALPDRDKDGVADTAVVAASGFVSGHDVRFWNDTMFVATEHGVYALRDVDGDLKYEMREHRINKQIQPNQTGGNHVTRTLAIDTVSRKLFLSVGSRGNNDRESNRAVIESYDLDGSNRALYASGVRNAVGMTIHPVTGRLWANNNGSDLAGDDIPGEWVDMVRDGGFYGYPIAHHHRSFFDFTNSQYRKLLPITAEDSVAVRSMSRPAALVAAHSAPMAIEFVRPEVPSPYRNGAFMVLRGSWNRRPASGSKIVWLEFDDHTDTVANAVHDFCTGFMLDSVSVPPRRWGRPVGLATSADGSVYITSDDITHVILKLTPPSATSIENRPLNTGSLRVSPNPASDRALLQWSDAPLTTRLSVYASSGELVHSRQLLEHEIVAGLYVNTQQFTSGSYRIQLTCADGRRVDVPLVVSR